MLSRWAILKCRFADDSSDTPPDSLYERLFTRAGAGTSNMVDFFHDVSHGRLDIGESQVFGWFTLNINRIDFAGNVADAALSGVQVNRNSLFATCRAAAVSAGVSLARFDGVLVTMNRGRPSHDGTPDGVDLWGAADMRVFCDRYSLQPSLLGQEMGHGYGLTHSRRDGSISDYQDPWDVMSTAAAYMISRREYGLTGPGLNGINMMLQRWFDTSRLWSAPVGDFETRVPLRPLHRADLEGPLGALLPDMARPGQNMLIEFRDKSRWDAGVPQSAALMHRGEGRVSYLVPGPAGSRDYLIAGDVVEFGEFGSPFSDYLRIAVESIDETTKTCTLLIRRRRSSISADLSRISAAMSLRVLGRVPVDGSGAVVLPSGQIVPVGPFDPMLSILSNVANVQSARMFDDTLTSEAAQRAAISKIASTALDELARLDPFRVPAKQRTPVKPPPKRKK
jgi:hypothetical protein